jgi:hypothetical protein
MFSRQDPWHNDGDLVLVCHNAGFRVHLDVLAASCNVFRYMAEMPQPREGCSEVFDGIPVVRLQDTVEDLTCFLHWIYELRYQKINSLIRIRFSMLMFHVLPRCSSTAPASLDFASASSLLRLGTKYDAPLMRQRVIDLFTSLYPSTSDAWARRDTTRPFPPAPNELSSTLALALAHDVQTLLPSLLYAACKLPLPEATSELLALPVHPTTVQDLYARFLRGRQALYRAELQALLSHLRPSFTQPKCRGRSNSDAVSLHSDTFRPGWNGSR